MKFLPKNIVILIAILFYLLTSVSFAYKTQVIHLKTLADFEKGSFMLTTVNSSGVSIKKEDAFLPLKGTYISPEIIPDFEFNEVILSWISDCPQNTNINLYMRVKINETWSDWFCTGKWTGTPKTVNTKEEDEIDEDTTKVEEIKPVIFDIDTLKINTEKAEKIQARVDFMSFDIKNAPVIKLLSFCISDNDYPTPIYKTKFPKDKWAKILPVPFITQGEGQEYRSRVCGPTSLTMLMRFYNISSEVIDTALMSYDEENDAFGNWSYLIATAGNAGLTGWVTRFYSLDEVKEQIANGFPVIAGIAYKKGELKGSPVPSSAGHLLVIRGFTSSGNVIVNDPAFSDEENGFRIYLKADFEKVWLGHGGYALIIRPE